MNEGRELMRDCFLNLTGIYMSKPNDVIVKLLFECVVPVMVIEQGYKFVVNEGLTPIEGLPEDKKRTLYDHAREIYPTGSKQQLITLCKALWLKENI